MTTMGMRRAPARTVGRSFYLVMSLLMAAIFVAGFSTTVPDDFATDPGLPWLLHVHGAVFTLWVVVFVAQPAFIARGSLDLHRRIGMLGAVLAGAMVVMGIAATIFAIRYGRVPGFFPPGIFLVMNVLGILVFGGLVGAGIAMRRRPEWHKRLMLCATISILGPGLGRLLPVDGLGPAAPLAIFGVVLLFTLAGPACDLVVRRRVHPANLWGLATIVVSMAAIGPIGLAPPIAGLVTLIRA